MTLDLARLAAALGDGLPAGANQRDHIAQLSSAWENLDSADLRERLRTAKTSWLLAGSSDDYRSRYPRPELPSEFTVVATDGSSIAPDRHSPIRFYVNNLGTVRIRYGTAPSAEISAAPFVCADESCLYAPSVVRSVPVTGQLFGLKRQVDELRSAIDAVENDDPSPVILQDGSLIFWGLESQPEEVVGWILGEAMAALDACRQRNAPVAGFISYPGATDVMNSLRVSVCDYPPAGRSVNCDHCRARIITEGRTPACDALPNVPDRVLWNQIAGLQAGERTQVFSSSSQILGRYLPAQWIHFFYLKLDTEIARVETPRWVAHSPRLLDLVHAAIVDQCEKGRGYPVALQEAHEAAVIRGSERLAVEAMIEQALAERGVFFQRSAKDGSKRVRFV